MDYKSASTVNYTWLCTENVAWTNNVAKTVIKTIGIENIDVAL